MFPPNLPSQWRLGMLQSVLLLGFVLLCMVVVRVSLQGDLRTTAAAIVLDELSEHSALYGRAGADGVASVYYPGRHEEYQGIRVDRIDGKVLFEHIPQSLKGFKWPDDPPPNLRLKRTILQSLDHSDSGVELLLGCSLLSDGNVLWFGRTNVEDMVYVDQIQRYIWMAGLAATFFALLPMLWFSRHVLRPVAEMIASAKRIAQGNTTARLAAPSAVPELREFATVFNQGLDQIAALTAELHSANDLLAHELRTPLARIRGNLELYMDHTDHPTACEAAARGMEEIDRASKLIKTILTTRAGEHKALKLHLEVHDVGLLVQSLYDLYLPAAEDLALRFLLEVPETRIVLLDRERLIQALANLLDNAFAYTPKFGFVTLALEMQPSSVRFVVRDTGPGIQPTELQRIWMRHVRGSAASARTPGMGLGLSLVRAIANAHNGWADGRNRSGSGSEFWIDLPTPEVASPRQLELFEK